MAFKQKPGIGAVLPILARDATAGFVVSIAAVAFYISSAALLFQGPLAPYLPKAIGAALAGGALLSLFWAWRGSLQLASVGPEPATVPILAGMTSAIALQCSPAAAFSTAIVALGLTAFLIGLVWYALGRLAVGDLIRFIPYPVIGGFFAAIGWLMLSGGVGVVVGKSFNWELAQRLVSQRPSGPLLCGLAAAGVLWWVTQRVKHVFVLPIMLLVFSVAIHLGLFFTGFDLEQARAAGWLMPDFAKALPGLPLAPATLQGVDWHVLWQQWPAIISAIIISLIALLLSDSSLEAGFSAQADFDNDLKCLGLGNIVMPLFGGLAGGVSVSRSLLNREAGAVGRVSALAKGAMCVIVMLSGGALISLIPKAVLGGLLIYMGIGLLKLWVFDGRSRLARSDYLVVLAILFATIAMGYLPSIMLGVVICCFDFAMATARTSQISRDFSRNQWPSKVERSAVERAYLTDIGSRLHIVELQGTLFFGSVRELAQTLKKLMSEAKDLDCLIIDFRKVRWVDSSAAQSMTRIFKFGGAFDVDLVFTGLRSEVKDVLSRNGCLQPARPRLAATIDDAVVAWEDKELLNLPAQQDPVRDWFKAELGSDIAAAELLADMDELRLVKGESLVSQGDASDALYFVREGRLDVSVDVDGSDLHLRLIQPGGTVGEMGVYLTAKRTATVRASTSAIVLRLTKTKLDEIEVRSPSLAIALHKIFVRLLASRLAHANLQTAALSV
jgi:SulP family sulfate permease